MGIVLLTAVVSSIMQPSQEEATLCWYPLGLTIQELTKHSVASDRYCTSATSQHDPSW